MSPKIKFRARGKKAYEYFDLQQLILIRQLEVVILLIGLQGFGKYPQNPDLWRRVNEPHIA